LIKVFEEFKTICHGKEILDSVKEETSGDLRVAYETMGMSTNVIFALKKNKLSILF
jgi:hypothetical protein